MNNLTEAVTDWIRGERIPQSRALIIDELTLIARLCNGWPTATACQWNEAIDAAIESGKVVEFGGLLRVAPVAAPVDEEVQLELF